MLLQKLLRHLNKSVIILLCLVFSAATSAAAPGELRSAEDDLAKAQNDYYRALKSGKASTPDEQARLREQIITPARQKIGEVIQNAEQNFLKKYIGSTTTRPPEQPEQNHEAGAQYKFSGDQVVGTGGGPEISRSPVPLPVTPRAKSREPEVVIDGSQFPKELEFVKPKSTPSARPMEEPIGLSPSRSGDGVTEIEFQPRMTPIPTKTPRTKPSSAPKLEFIRE
ncbi:MAG: hypothetical protein A2428_14470 [Bdellovibrionales bacterium RIFOXYC1_FULL_54_43]|nr:MAG: hypothetical protein A2428_14470 [Bdellovibrionales bacterium RIFOXYC1_FULL_54_43]OFZ78338.1 MAG: hypothetical protein A2603_12430 [Bdellovibrionales bacterium RIFOXYD1_FULL_55_31]